MFLTSYTLPLLSCYPFPNVTPVCQTAIFAHVRQRAAGSATQYRAAFESDRQRQTFANEKDLQDWLSCWHRHKQKYEWNSRTSWPYCAFSLAIHIFYTWTFLLSWHLLLFFIFLYFWWCWLPLVKRSGDTVNYRKRTLYSRLYIITYINISYSQHQ